MRIVKLSVEDKFWSKIEKGNHDDCWPWKGRCNERGYGRFRFQGRTRRSHRIAFYLEKGHWPYPCCLHTCDNRKCCNVRHMLEGTNADNSADMVAKQRQWRGNVKHRPNSKLSKNDVMEIRRLCAMGMLHRDVAVLFNISRPHVGDIVNKTRWSWL